MRQKSTTTHAHQLRSLLLEKSDGLSIPEISRETGVTPSSIHRALCGMVDAYIDRWEKATNKNGRSSCYRAVWCVVEIPPNTPRPGK